MCNRVLYRTIDDRGHYRWMTNVEVREIDPQALLDYYEERVHFKE